MNQLFFRVFIAMKNRQEGASAVEYGMLVALIAAVIIGTVAVLGGQINNAFTLITDKLSGNPATGG